MNDKGCEVAERREEGRTSTRVMHIYIQFAYKAETWKAILAFALLPSNSYVERYLQVRQSDHAVSKAILEPPQGRTGGFS